MSASTLPPCAVPTISHTPPRGLPRTKMELLLMSCDREIPTQQQKTNASTTVRDSLSSIPARVEETVQCEGRIREAKEDRGKLRMVCSREI